MKSLTCWLVGACVGLALVDGWAAEAVEVRTLAMSPGNGGITVHPDGDIYVGEYGNYQTNDGTRVFRITPAGDVFTFATGLGLSNSGNDFDAQGNLIQSAWASNVVRRINPQGQATNVAQIQGAVGVVAMPGGEIFVASCAGQSSIQRIAPNGNVSTFANHPGFACTNGLTRDPEGNLYTINWGDGNIFRITPQAEVSLFAELGTPGAHIVYGNGEFYATARLANAVYRITMAGEVARIAGSGDDGHEDGLPLEASFSAPNGIGISNDGRFLYVNGTSSARFAGGDHFGPLRVIELRQEASFPINFGHTGSWYNPGTDGQGFSIEVVASSDTGEPDQVVAYWFTFAKGSPGGVNRSRWFQAVGPIGGDEGDSVVMDVYQVTGGVFDDPAEASSDIVGAATLSFTSCTEGTIAYELDLNGDETAETTGEIPLTRLTPDIVCTELSG